MSAHVLPKSTYYAIFAALMVLTAVTITVAFVNLGPVNFAVAISIAIVKATLVILYFMHVKFSSRLTKLVVAIGFFFLLVLFTLTLTDYLTRGWQTYPATTPNSQLPTPKTTALVLVAGSAGCAGSAGSDHGCHEDT